MLPLEGTLVLDLTQVIAGPTAGQILGDMGADVIKVEPLTGDHFRPQLGGAWVPGMNRNKRGLAVDLKTAGGREVLAKLIARADVFMEAFVPGVMAKFGFDYAAVSAINPRIVYLSISGYGQTGPYSPRAGYDPCIQAEVGLMEATGQADGPPTRVGAAPVDQGTGTYGALGIAMALLARHRTGKGQHIDLSLYDVGVQIMSHWLTSYGHDGKDPQRMGTSHTLICPLRTFATMTKPIYVACTNDGIWAKLIAALDMKHLGADPRFRTNAERLANRAALEPLLEARFASETCEALLDRLNPVGVPSAAVKTLSDLIADPHAKARGSVLSHEYPGIGTVMAANNPLKMSDAPVTIQRRAPFLGEHTEELLKSVGYGDDDIKALATSKAVLLWNGDATPSAGGKH